MKGVFFFFEVVVMFLFYIKILVFGKYILAFLKLSSGIEF